jgi:imidazolonepropionase-like amidohydrolase
MIDSQRGSMVKNAVIQVRGEHIVSVESNGRIPADARVIDLSDATVLPGLIDCHTHLTVAPGVDEGLGRRNFVDAAIMAPSYALATLEAGFTTVRDLGAPSFVDVRLRNAINRGDIPGPRILAATMSIGATGGHSDINGYSPYLDLGEFSGIADGELEIRKKVRWEIKHGADVIKVMATAGAMSEEDSVDAALYTQEELNAVVDEARMWGRRVAAHAHGAEGIKRAVRAGVASIDRGTFLDAEGAKMMAELGTYLVKDSYEDRWFMERAPDWGYPQIIVGKLGLIVAGHEAAFRLAMKHSVKIAFGTDAGVNPHGDNARQFRDYIAWGMTPMDAILTATRNAADLIGWNDRVGAVAPGFYADIIAVPGNPLEDPMLLESVSFVMKGGAVIKQ